MRKKGNKKEDILIKISAGTLIVIIAMFGLYLKEINKPARESLRGNIGELYTEAAGNQAPSVGMINPVFTEAIPQQQFIISSSYSDPDGVNDLIYGRLIIDPNANNFPNLNVLLDYFPNTNNLTIYDQESGVGGFGTGNNLIASYAFEESTDYPRGGSDSGTTTGSGTRISTCAELSTLPRANPSATFYLSNDIDCTGYSTLGDGNGFYPLGLNTADGSVNAFTGTFDGMGHKITGLFNTFRYYGGMFGRTNSATIKNFTMENVYVHLTGSYDPGQPLPTSAGALITIADNTKISYVKLKNVDIQAAHQTGSLAASLSNSKVDYVSVETSKVESTGAGSGSGHYTGGLAGYFYKSDITNSYVASLTAKGISSTGGFAGWIGWDSYGSIINCYASGSVNAVRGDAGGFIGDNPYTGGSMGTTITSNYWDITGAGGDIGGNRDNANIFKKTTAEMKQQSTYSGWDFTNIWRINNGNDYPKLKTFLECGDGVCNGAENCVSCTTDCGCDASHTCDSTLKRCAICVSGQCGDIQISDNSGYNNNGVVGGVISATGHKAQAFSFNGVSDYASIPDSSSLDLNNKFTISAWIYRTKNAGTWERIVSKSDINDYDYWMQITGSGKIGGGFKNSSGSLQNSLDTSDSGTTIPLNQWVHVSIVYNGSFIKAYYNGVLDKSFSSSGTPRLSSKPLQIGRLGSGGKWYYNFTGAIDEVKIWNVSLNDREIMSEYQNGNPQAIYSCTLGESKTIENSKAQINCANTNKAIAGNSLNINWALTLKNSLAYGLYPVYPYAKDSMNQRTPMEQKGNISFVALSNIPNQAPIIGTLTPSSWESYVSQPVKFSASYSDPDGVNDLTYARIIIDSNISKTNYDAIIDYFPNADTIAIYNEANNSQVVGSCGLGESKTIENLNVKIDCSQFAALESGKNLTLNLSLISKDSFADSTKNIYLYAKDNSNHNISEKKGNWSIRKILINYPPTADSLNPATGEFFTDEGSTFTAYYSDTNGFNDIVSAYLAIDTNLSDTQKLLVIYYPVSRMIQIRNDINNSKIDGNCTIGENKTISNYYANISCFNSGTSGSGGTLNVDLNFIFKEKLIGLRKIFIKAGDANGTSSGWKEVGNITISKKTVFNCTDSDGGKNYSKKGIANGTNGVSIDYCINTTVLREYYCSSSGATSYLSYTCPGKCSNGTCVEVKQTATPTTTTTTTTTTSDEKDKSEVYGSTGSNKTKLEKTPVEGKTAGEIVLWAIIWTVSILFVIVLIYFIYSLSKKRALIKKSLDKKNVPIIRQMPPRVYRQPFRR